MHMAKSGLHPHCFIYPTLFPSILLLLYGAHFILGYASGRFVSVEAFKALYYTDPSSFYLIARMVGAISGILTVYLVYCLGKRLFGTSVGLLSALFLALCPIHVRNSHFGNVDVPMTCLTVLALIFILDVYRTGRLRDYLLAGAISGLATSTKYPAGILCFSILVAHLLRGSESGRTGWRALIHPYLWIAALAMVGTFFISSPYILIDWNGFVNDFRRLASVLSGEYVGSGYEDYGAGWVYHAMFSFRYGLGIAMEVLAVAGVIWAAWRRKPEELVVLSLFIYILLIGGKSVFTRYVIPIAPMMMVFAAALLLRLGDLLANRRLRTLVVCGAVALILAEPVHGIVQFERILLREDTRLQAAAWIRAHIPDGSTVALHGGYYAEPQLPESGDMLRERLKEQPGPNRDTYLLEHPVSPRYRLIRLGYFESSRKVRYSWIVLNYDWSTLRERSVEYVITQESPRMPFATVDDQMRAILKAHATPIAVFDPFAPGVSLRPVYDPIDAFFVPMAGVCGRREARSENHRLSPQSFGRIKGSRFKIQGSNFEPSNLEP